jgi:hypothetical protein
MPTLEADTDDVAGVVDLFGALTREELDRALEELAYKRRVEPPDSDLIERAVSRYALVTHEREEGEVFVPGPSAFPTLPDGAADLPHILDVPKRAVDREAVEREAEERFRKDVARALGEGDDELVTRLLDVSYDLDAWGLDMTDLRERLDAARASEGEREG